MLSLKGAISFLIDVTPLTANLGEATGKKKGVIKAGTRVKREHKHVLIASFQLLLLMKREIVRIEMKSAKR